MGIKDSLSNLKIKYQAWSRKIVDLTKEPDNIYGEGWDKLGFHRPVAKYLYTFGLLIPQVVLGLLLLPLLKFTELRYPEIGSFEIAAGALFGALYTVLDLNLQPAVDRFVPQYSITDPRKAMEYITFFIKYQMWSGLIQIAFVAIFMFMYIVPYTSFTYLAWFILFINIKQYPAILSTFQSAISSLQHGDKDNLITFYRASLLEPITRIVGGLIGMWWGARNPMFGELYGMAIGFAIGGYVDDFLVFTLGMYWLSKIIDKYGIRIWELYAQSVPEDVWKSAMSYSMRLMPATIFGAVMGFFNFLITYEGLPGYSSFQGIFKMSDSLRKFTGWSELILNNSQPCYSEAFNNGKPTLTKYYIAEGLKYNYLFFAVLGSINIFALPIILRIALGVFISEQYEMVAIILPIQMVLLTLHAPYENVANRMILISGHPEIISIWGIISTIMGTFFTWYFLIVLRMSWLGVILAGIPGLYLGVIIKWIYMKKKVLDLNKQFWKDIAWQCFLAPLGAGAVFVGFMLLILRGLWPIVSAPFSGDLILIPAIICVALILVGIIVIYFPLVSYLGFFDERSLLTFRRSVALSGPSIWLIWPMYRIFYAMYQKSPFKKQCYMKIGEQADKELKELMLLRYDNFVQYLKNKPAQFNGDSNNTTNGPTP